MSIFMDKVIVLTGAGSGIGCAVAENLARQGGVVVVTDRDGESAAAVAEGILNSGGRATAATLDVTDAEAVQQQVARTMETHGRIDYIFNNAGISVYAEIADHTLADWNVVLDVNLKGVIHGVHATYPVMKRQGFGHIVNTASLAGLLPVVNGAAYATSKFAVVGLTTTLRAEAAAYGVKASVVCPGFVDTPILFEHCNNKYLDKMGVTSREQVKQRLGFKAMDVNAAAAVICRGVAKNRAIILVTPHAKVLSSIQRLSPWINISLSKMVIKHARKLYRV